MSSNALAAPVPKTVAATGTLTTLFAIADRYRQGVLIANPTSGDVFAQLRPVSDDPPTAAQVLASWSYRIPAGSTLPIAAGALTAVYLAAATAGTANVQEVG